MNRIHQKQLKHFAQTVKNLRSNKNYTQEDLAAMLDIDVRTVKRIESGDYNPTLISMMEIADVLDVTLKDLL